MQARPLLARINCRALNKPPYNFLYNIRWALNRDLLDAKNYVTKSRSSRTILILKVCSNSTLTRIQSEVTIFSVINENSFQLTDYRALEKILINEMISLTRYHIS